MQEFRQNNFTYKSKRNYFPNWSWITLSNSRNGHKNWDLISKQGERAVLVCKVIVCSRSIFTMLIHAPVLRNKVDLCIAYIIPIYDASVLFESLIWFIRLWVAAIKELMCIGGVWAAWVKLLSFVWYIFGIECFIVVLLLSLISLCALICPILGVSEINLCGIFW